MNENTVVTRPRKRFDREYATEWRKERDWLAERGFMPTYVKRVGDGIERYKYKKTAELFEHLALFYRMQAAPSLAFLEEDWEDDTL